MTVTVASNHRAVKTLRKTLSKKVIGLALGALLFAIDVAAPAQAMKGLKIGYLSSVDAVNESPCAEGVRLALRELGYIEGQKHCHRVQVFGGEDGSCLRACGRVKQQNSCTQDRCDGYRFPDDCPRLGRQPQPL